MKLSFHPYPLLLRHTFTVAGSSRTATPALLVAIEHDGITGYGEAALPPYLGWSVAEETAVLRRVDLGLFASPAQIDDIMDYVDALALGHAPARAAIDIALHDWAGRAAGVPLRRVWSLDPADAPPTTYTIGIDTPAAMQDKVREVAVWGFTRYKIKVGTATDRDNLRALRAVTDAPLAVDANQGWSDREAALDMIYWLATQGVYLVEQPLPKERIDDLAWLTERSPLPIVADESAQTAADVPRLAGAVTGVNVKLMKCGGLRAARRMIGAARAAGLRVMMGCMTETSCAVTAAALLAPLADWIDLDGNLLIANDPFIGLAVRGGRIHLPDTPGIGITPASGIDINHIINP